MNMVRYFQSISEEITTLKSRIRDLMINTHWLTDGEWKESVLRTILRRHLPESIKVGRGFIVTGTRSSTQIDVLLYDNSYPLIFKDGDLVFVTPDAVRGIIEVKSNATTAVVSEALDKLSQLTQMVNYNGDETNSRLCFTGLFSFENEVNENRLLQMLREKSEGDINRVITHLSMGSSVFVRYWKESPQGFTNRWHSYNFEALAPAYFITNILEWITPQSLLRNDQLWFPLDTKERHKTGHIDLYEEKFWGRE